MKTSFLSQDELASVGLKSYGRNVQISRYAQFYGSENIEIGDNVRIDDFCVLSGNIELGNFIHISAYTALYGRFGIELDDFSGLSPRCTVFSASDDFSGDFMIGPLVNNNYTNVYGSIVKIGKHCQVGSGSVILPSVRIHDGSVVGAMSLVVEDLDEWGIYAGIPVRRIRDRSRNLLNSPFPD